MSEDIALDTISVSEQVKRIAEAVRSRQPLPPMGFENLEQGYQVQQQVTALINGDVTHGLKAGVTTVAMQQQLGLKAPLIASLYTSGKLKNGCELSLVDGQELECEIGVIVDGAGHPIGLMPVVEIVYLAFSRTQDFSLANAVAANLGADRYICGDLVPWRPELDSLQIRVMKDGVEVANVSNDYSFGSPENAARWFVAEANAKGLWPLGSETCLLSLGTCGSALKGEKGSYRVSFGVLGNIHFKLV